MSELKLRPVNRKVKDRQAEAYPTGGEEKFASVLLGTLRRAFG
jgi:hypothetical protein